MVGDYRYGADADAATSAAPKRPLHLHAHELRFEHPTSGASVHVVGSLPSWARDDADDPA